MTSSYKKISILGYRVNSGWIWKLSESYFAIMWSWHFASYQNTVQIPEGTKRFGLSKNLSGNKRYKCENWVKFIWVFDLLNVITIFEATGFLKFKEGQHVCSTKEISARRIRIFLFSLLNVWWYIINLSGLN